MGFLQEARSSFSDITCHFLIVFQDDIPRFIPLNFLRSDCMKNDSMHEK